MLRMTGRVVIEDPDYVAAKRGHGDLVNDALTFEDRIGHLAGEHRGEPGQPALIAGDADLLGADGARCLASLDRRMAPAHHTGGWWALVGVILPVYMVILMRGSLLQATGALFVAIVCLLFVRRGTRQRNGPQVALRSPPY